VRSEPAGPVRCPRDLLTALVMVRRLIDAAPAETLAGDDLWDELGRLHESVEAGRSHAELTRAVETRAECGGPGGEPLGGG
jgi:hypothetical protein